MNNSVSSKDIKSSHLSVNNFSKDDDENVISFINDLFLKALQKQASDIHLEPTNENIRIRFRIDGEFVNYRTLELKKLDSLIARVKIMAYLRIDEHRLPQD
jgi:type II secretory ATPase GspE/PulE/Tfp pilus assembly ATPase PilB-like protein